jgi:nucleoside-diphosphate-sugar epimerase
MVTDPVIGFKHAFVTGATGIVGVPLCRALVRAGVRVTAFSRNPAIGVLPKEVIHVKGSILDRDALDVAAEGADVVFHVAAAVHGSASTYSDFERVNVTGTENVIDAALEFEANLVHVSTVNVEGFRAGTLRDSYAETKSVAEELVMEAVDDGMTASIVRPATVFGNEVGRAGLLVDRLLAGSLKVLPAPSRRISPVWAGDLAQALILAADNDHSGRVFTVAGPTVSTGEFVKSVTTAAGTRRVKLSIPASIFSVPLQLAWWLRKLSRWTPPVSVESLMNGSAHDGAIAASQLGFQYTDINDIFGVTTD